MAKRAQYNVVQTTYRKRPTGNILPNGKTEFVTVGEPTSKVLKNTNFAEINKGLFDKSQNNSNMFVNYEKPTFRIQKMPRKVKSVTVKNKDGSKTVSYFKPLRG